MGHLHSHCLEYVGATIILDILCLSFLEEQLRITLGEQFIDILYARDDRSHTSRR